MFDLTITFAGICLLVRDEDKGRMHVVMPQTGGMVHFPVLVFVDNSGTVQKVDIPPNTDIDLTGLTGSNGLNLKMPDGVFDFDGPPYGPRTVSRPKVEAKPFPPEVSIRANFAAGECKPLRRFGGFWDINSGGSVTTHRMATAVDWVIKDVAGSNLTVDLGSAGTRVVPLIGTSMHVLLVHVTPEEYKVLGEDVPGPSGPCPPADKPLHHFQLYFPVLSPSTVPDLPTFNKPRNVAEGVCPPSFAGVTDPGEATDDLAADRAADGEGGGTMRRAPDSVPGGLGGDAAAVGGQDAGNDLDSTDALVAAAEKFAAASNGGSELTCTIATVRVG